MRFAIIFAVAGSALACHMVDRDRISGKDLAAANPAFAALDAELDIAPAPLPGVQRIFGSDELLRVARRGGISVTAPVAEVCFARKTESLTPEEILPVLRAALGIEDAQIEILDFSRYGVPAGALQFTRSGLSQTGLWRGRVSFDENRTAPVWVKVRITVEQTWMEAIEPLAPGKPIDTAQLKVVRGQRAPFGPTPITAAALATGRAPLRAIKPGEPIFANMLGVPREVERGDKVAVEVVSGSARLSFDGVSQSAGRIGELILVRNPDNGRYFQARIEGKDKVSIHK